jgi:hypothetical protein
MDESGTPDDGDKSPAESGDKSPHSKNTGSVMFVAG